MRNFTLVGLLLLSTSCSLAKLTAGGVGAKVAPSQAMVNRGSPQKSVLIHGFLERQLEDTRFNALVAATAPDGNLVATTSVGQQGYYSIFLPPGTYRLTAFVDRDADLRIIDHEIAGQVSDLVVVPEDGSVAHFGLDIRLSRGPGNSLGQLTPVLHHEANGEGGTGSRDDDNDDDKDDKDDKDDNDDRSEELSLEEGIPSLEHTDELMASIYGQNNINRGTYESTTSFFNHVSPIQHLDEVDLTAGRIPIVFVHGIDDSPQIFDRLEERLRESRYEPLFFYYPTGARLPAMAQLLYHLFFSGKVLPSFDESALIAHSMGGLVARGSLNYVKERPGQSTINFYGSFVSPYGGVSAAEYGIKTGPVIVPSWLDLAPNSQFLGGLFAPLPNKTQFSMINADAKKTSDGTIALSSQRRKEALAQAQHAQIFPQTHVGIMSDPAALQVMLDWVDGTIKQALPQSTSSTADDNLTLTADGTIAQVPAQPLGDLERRRRARELRKALVQSFAKQQQTVLVSLITPTVARLRILDDRAAIVVQVSVGEGVRLDTPEQNAPLFLQKWPDSADGLKAIAERVVQLSQDLLTTSTQNPEPEIPAALRLDSQHQKQSATSGPQIARVNPPPVVLATGLMGAFGLKPEAPRFQIPIKADGYFGRLGFGLDLRFTALGALAKTPEANLLFEPIILGGGPRIRFGQSSSLLSFAFGLNFGMETGNVKVLEPDSYRFGYRDDDVIRTEWILNSLAYASGTLGVRIHGDFYAIALGEFGLRFPERTIAINEQSSVLFLHHSFISTMLGAEVRIP